MIGAIIGDVVGSIYEWNNIKTKEFELFSKDCHFTDDSLMTIAVMKAFLDSEQDQSKLQEKTIHNMVELGRKYYDCGFGPRFQKWLLEEKPTPYNSFGNGAAMRVSAAGIVAKTIEEAKTFSRIITEISHNHTEGLKAAEAVATAIFLARQKKSISEIREWITKNYYDLDFTLDSIRKNYTFDVSCQGSVPQAIVAFLESTNFEDAIRNAVSIGGDSDTIAAITGSIAGAYYQIPDSIQEKAMTFLPDDLKDIINQFMTRYDKENLLSRKRIHHSYGVALKMAEIGREKGYTEEEQEDLFLLGFLHDFGYHFMKNGKSHGIVGGEILKRNHYQYWQEVSHHEEDDSPYQSSFLDILQQADMQIDKNGEDVGYQKRLEDIKSRYGEDSKVYQKCQKIVKKIQAKE